jgi:hypothetical protein
MILEEQIHQEADKQIEEIKSLFPRLEERELKYIHVCLRSAYTKGAMDALDNKKEGIFKARDAASAQANISKTI